MSKNLYPKLTTKDRIALGDFIAKKRYPQFPLVGGFARWIGVSVTIIKKIEKGNFKTIPLPTMTKVLVSLGISCEKLDG